MHNYFTLCHILISLLFVFCLPSLSKAQNCAIPSVISLPVHLSECASFGALITNLTVENIEEIINVTQWPYEFAHVGLNNGNVFLVVKTPLHLFSNETQEKASNFLLKTYIDESWSENVEVHVEFKCSDGMDKKTTFIIPIDDKNTMAPFFEFQNYSLTMGPCYNGTHNKACPLNFETPILVLDADRDCINADMDFSTKNDSGLIRISSDVVTVSNSKATSHNHHMLNVRLYLEESTRFNEGEAFSFTLIAYNKRCNTFGEYLSANTTITIFFGETSDGGNHTLISRPPVFSSNYYYITLTNIFDALPGVEVKNLKPGIVSTNYGTTPGPKPNVYGYGDVTPDEEEKGQLNVKYSLKSDLLTIDPDTGKLYFKMDFSSLSERIYEYEIIAEIESHSFLSSEVPLVIFNNLEQEDTTQPPQCPTEITCPDITTTENWNASTSTSFYSTTGITETSDWNSSTQTVTTELVTLPDDGESGEETVDPTTDTTNNPTTSTTNNPITDTTTNPTTTSTTDTTTNPTTTSATSNPTTHSTITEPVSTTNDNEDLISTTQDPIGETEEPSTEQEPTSTTPNLITEMPELPSTTTEEEGELEPEITTTTEIVETTTVPPSDCCNNCTIIKDFRCPEGDYSSDLLFPDPHRCEVYHQCQKFPGDLVPTPVQFNCSDGQIFCPTKQTCVFPNECPCTEIPIDDGCMRTTSECGACDSLEPGAEGNMCEMYNETIPFGGIIPDPKYFDIFHSCVKTDGNGYFDWIMPCTKGTVYCENLFLCGHPYSCSTGSKVPYKCDLCESFYSFLGISLGYN